MVTETLEQRVANLESAVQQLQRQVNRASPVSDWLEKMIGAFKDEPAFDEVAAYGRAIREGKDIGNDGGDSH